MRGTTTSYYYLSLAGRLSIKRTSLERDLLAPKIGDEGHCVVRPRLVCSCGLFYRVPVPVVIAVNILDACVARQFPAAGTVGNQLTATRATSGTCGPHPLSDNYTLKFLCQRKQLSPSSAAATPSTIGFATISARTHG